MTEKKVPFSYADVTRYRKFIERMITSDSIEKANREFDLLQNLLVKMEKVNKEIKLKDQEIKLKEEQQMKENKQANDE